MKKNLCLLLLIAFSPLHAEFSFKRVSNWVFRYKDEPFHKEYPFDTAGTVEVQNQLGEVTVKTWDLPQILVKAQKTANEKDLEHLNVIVDMADNKATIQAKAENDKNKGSIDITLMVPRKTNLKIAGHNHPVQVKNCDGSLVAKTTNGAIDLKNCTNSIKAESVGGKIALSCKSVSENNHIKLESIKNNITISLPKKSNAEVVANTVSGTITSDHPICLKSKTCKLNSASWQQLQRNIEGTLGEGGAQIALNSTKGSIKIVQ